MQTAATQRDATAVGDGDGGVTGAVVICERSPARLGALEADETHLYWMERSSAGFHVVRAPKNSPRDISIIGSWSGSDVGTQLMGVDSSHVFWIEDSKINKFDKSSAKTEVIELGVAPFPGGWRILVDGAHVYFTDRGCLNVGRISKAGGAPSFSSVADHVDLGSSSLAVDATSVYCGSGTDLLMMPKEGGAAVKLATVASRERVGPMISDGDFVYWANNRAQLGTGLENLAMVAKSGGAPADLGVIGFPVAQIRHDRDRRRLYGTTSRSSHRDVVFTVSTADRTVTQLAEQQHVWGGVAQDERYLYWASETAMVRMAK